MDAIGNAIDLAARWGVFRPLCLTRSLAFRELLERDGFTGSWVRVGVRMGPQGFEAHAWVEWEGRVVGEDPSYVAEYLPLADRRADSPEFASKIKWAETRASHDA